MPASGAINRSPGTEEIDAGHDDLQTVAEKTGAADVVIDWKG